MFQSVLRKLTVFNNEQLLNNAVNTNQVRLKYVSKILRKRNPVWFIRKELKRPDEHVTRENRDFVKEVVEDKLGKLDEQGKELITSKYLTPLKGEMLQQTQWTPQSKRCGLIARKIGVYPMWTKTGHKYLTTLLQVLDNQVIKHFKAGDYKPLTKRPTIIRNRNDVMLIGAEGTDPTRLTKEYCGLFKDAGVMPKAVLLRFFCTPECVMPVGTTLNALHFRVGDYVDVRAKTISRGFQGVMKRWGFKGMPATHGVTKTHRRPGNIGGGGEKGRVWPGKKMPGHMGNRYRIARALKILRISPKFNVIWVKGQAIAGETNSICVLHDSIVWPRRPVNPHCPTFIADNNPTVDIENDIYDEEMYKFSDPTITFKIEPKKKK